MPRKGVAKTSNAEKFKKVKQYADKLKRKEDATAEGIKLVIIHGVCKFCNFR